MDFKEFIKNDRESRNQYKFEGTFLEYLELVKDNPDIPKLSHKRIYDLIIEQGFEILRPEENQKIKKLYGNEKIKKYNFFKDDFYGIDRVVMKLMNYLYSASMKGSIALSNKLHRFPVLKPILCGMLLGACALVLPNVLFSGEAQSHKLMTTWTTFTAITLLATGFIKAAITPVCLQMGWNGGNFFPCIFAGVSCGYGFASLCGADPMFCVVIVTTTFLATTIRKPLMTIGLLLMCFPVNSMLWMGLAAVVGSVLPLPKALRKTPSQEGSDV